MALIYTPYFLCMHGFPESTHENGFRQVRQGLTEESQRDHRVQRGAQEEEHFKGRYDHIQFNALGDDGR